MTRTVEDERNTALLAWYAKDQRELPWRNTSDPYLVLVSEVMLQQTQVDRVIPFFKRFIARFPTVDALAGAGFIEVAGLWSGLGYNTRAKRLHEAAKVVTATGWPTTVAGLQQLPGVGAYTSRAVAAFAFGARVAAVDTNLKRVLSRWHGEGLEGGRLEAAAMRSLSDDASTWNHAMMDLGATLCSPRRAKCHKCPVSSWCAGPDTYVSPRPQPRFVGSLRQVRGAVMRQLVRGPARYGDLVDATGFEPLAVTAALEGLASNGLVTQDDGRYLLTD